MINWDIYEDEARWIRFESDEGDICVYCRCPECGRFIKHGKCYENLVGQVTFEGFICKKHGELRPFWIRD